MASRNSQVWDSKEADVLKSLLAPLDPLLFVEKYFGREPLYVKGTPDKFKTLFNRKRFDKAVKAAFRKSHVPSFRLSAVVRDLDGSWSVTEPIKPKEIPAALADGYTVCVNDITLGDEKLAALCLAIKSRMNFAGRVRFNCYLSPDASGTDTHFDTSVSTTLQIEGTKRWRYAERPAVPWPPSNAILQTDGARQWKLPWIGQQPWEQLDEVRTEEFKEVILEPGDLLCLPAGTWHNARAIGHSLALNMAFSPISCISLLTRILQDVFDGDESWRGGPPPAYQDQPDGVQLPASVQNYFEARLQEVRSKLNTIDARGELVQRPWRELVDPQS